ELDEHPRLTTLAGADRLVRLGVETYDWMRESALGRATTPPPATAVQQLRDAALLDPHSPDRPQLETHWLQLLRRALNSPVRLDLVSIDGARAWTTTIHVAGQMLLALDQGREVLRARARPAPHRPDRPQLETHWLQLLRRALTSPVRLDLVSIDGARAWTTTIHVAGQMLLALDQVREVFRDDGALELGRRSSALT